MQKFIVIYGQKQNGKSTLARYLQQAFKEQDKEFWTIDGFARPLRWLMKDWYNLTTQQIEHYKVSDKPFPGSTVPLRYLICEFAKIARSADPNVFVKMLLHRLIPDSAKAIVDDGRFENEAIKCKAEGAYNIFLCRPSHIASPIQTSNMDDTERWCGKVASTFLHHENPQCKEDLNKLPIHQYIMNNSTLENLYEVAQQLAYKLRMNYLQPHWDGR